MRRDSKMHENHWKLGMILVAQCMKCPLQCGEQLWNAKHDVRGCRLTAKCMEHSLQCKEQPWIQSTIRIIWIILQNVTLRERKRMTRLFYWAADWIMHGPTMARTWPDHDPWHPPVRTAYLSDFGDACAFAQRSISCPGHLSKTLVSCPTSHMAPKSCACREKWRPPGQVINVNKVAPATKSDTPLSPKCSFCDFIFLWLFRFGALYNNTLLQLLCDDMTPGP